MGLLRMDLCRIPTGEALFSAEPREVLRRIALRSGSHATLRKLPDSLSPSLARAFKWPISGLTCDFRKQIYNPVHSPTRCVFRPWNIRRPNERMHGARNGHAS